MDGAGKTIRQMKNYSLRKTIRQRKKYSLRKLFVILNPLLINRWREERKPKIIAASRHVRVTQIQSQCCRFK
jgi:hypothetical protein